MSWQPTERSERLARIRARTPAERAARAAELQAALEARFSIVSVNAGPSHRLHAFSDCSHFGATEEQAAPDLRPATPQELVMLRRRETCLART